MTKLDFSSGKIQHFNEKQSPTNDYATDGNINNKKQPKNHFQHFFTKLGFNQKQDGIVPYIDSISIDMNWSFMLKVAAVQVSMSIVWIICSIIPMVLVNSINFSHLSLPIYVLLCAFLGLIAARRQSYPYAIVYCIMCAIQSMIHISIVFAFIVLFFKLLDYQSYNFIHDSISNADLIFRLDCFISMKKRYLRKIFSLMHMMHVKQILFKEEGLPFASEIFDIWKKHIIDQLFQHRINSSLKLLVREFSYEKIIFATTTIFPIYY
ncbi:putative heme-binding peroxidase [Dirofilaria immitis]